MAGWREGSLKSDGVDLRATRYEAAARQVARSREERSGEGKQEEQRCKVAGTKQGDGKTQKRKSRTDDTSSGLRHSHQFPYVGRPLCIPLISQKTWNNIIAYTRRLQ